jgi:hypothetical protein
MYYRLTYHNSEFHSVDLIVDEENQLLSSKILFYQWLLKAGCPRFLWDELYFSIVHLGSTCIEVIMSIPSQMPVSESWLSRIIIDNEFGVDPTLFHRPLDLSKLYIEPISELWFFQKLNKAKTPLIKTLDYDPMETSIAWANSNVDSIGKE